MKATISKLFVPSIRVAVVATLATLSAMFLTTASAESIALDSWSKVVAAVKQANLDDNGFIRLDTRAEFIVTEPLPIVTGDIDIAGNGATLRSSVNYHGALIQISPVASLKLADVHITGFDGNLFQTPVTFPALIDNHGRLQLDRVTFSENSSCDPCSESLPVLDNRGHTIFNNVTLFRNRPRAPERNHPPTSNIRNCGSMEIINSTFVENTASVGRGITGIQTLVPAAISAYITSDCGPGFFAIGNTLMANKGGNCAGLGVVSDLGGNFDSDGSCGFDPARNVINQSAGLARFDLHGGLVPTVGLEPTSAAIDIGMNEICSAIDARMASRPTQVRVGIEPTCDSGAFEYGGGFGNAEIQASGMNGLWYNADTDGHYVHVMRVSPDRVYISWTTFDENADQLWIFAVATTSDSNAFSAKAFVSLGGRLTQGGAPSGYVVEEWGVVELEFNSCTVGNFHYTAYDPSFGEGEFQLDRLAFIEGTGCSTEGSTK